MPNINLNNKIDSSKSVNKKIFKYFVFLVFTFLFSELVLNKFKLYYEFVWLDVFMHILGGFLVTGFMYYILVKVFKGNFVIFQKNNNQINTQEFSHFNTHIRVNLVILAFCVFIVGIDWEIFEYIRDILSVGYWRGDILDTISDIINDMIGFCLYIVTKKYIDKKSEF